jgi:uncharacterized protein YlxW (UPF0749 family)
MMTALGIIAAGLAGMYAGVSLERYLRKQHEAELIAAVERLQKASNQMQAELDQCEKLLPELVDVIESQARLGDHQRQQLAIAAAVEGWGNGQWIPARDPRQTTEAALERAAIRWRVTDDREGGC